MTGRLDGRVALITGGASGMGLATVRRFAAEGARVVMADLNEESAATALAALDAGDRVRFERVDVSAEADVERAVAAAVDAFGQLDIVFNNAGVGGAFGAVTDLHVEDWDYTFAVLVRGVFLGIKHGARQLIEQGWGGSIINTASIAGMSGGGGPLCYSAAKAAVINLTPRRCRRAGSAAHPGQRHQPGNDPHAADARRSSRAGERAHGAVRAVARCRRRAR